MRAVFKLSGFMVLLFSIVLQYACNKQSNQKQLRDSYWEAEYIIEQGGAPQFATVSYKLSFEKNDFSIQLDINSCGGEYRIMKNEQINFAPINCTEACCDSPFALKLLDIMQKATHYDLGEEHLIIKYEDVLARFKKTPV